MASVEVLWELRFCHKKFCMVLFFSREMYKTKISCLYIQFMYQDVSASALNIIKYIFRISYDPKRYPRYIPEAYCLCKGCLIGPHGEESSQYRSTLVYAPSVILRRTGSCVGGRHSYTEIYVSIAVGCTCLEKRPKKSNQSLQRREPKARKLFTPRKEAWRKQHCCCREVFFCLFFTADSLVLEHYVWNGSPWKCHLKR